MKSTKSIIAIFTLFFSIFTASSQQEVLGRWVTIDDKTNVEASIVEIYRAENGKYYGRVEALLVKGYEDMRCTECEGNLKDKPVRGMVILRDMEYVDGKLQHGSVLDPENGKTYYGKVWYDAKKQRLILRGSLDRRGIFGRNQEWKRK